MRSAVENVRLLAYIEGISLLLLFFVAMPLKYIYGYPQAVTTMGWIHGVLFMLFVVYATRTGEKENWSNGLMFQLVLSSMLPFGMVVMDRKLKRMEPVSSAASEADSASKADPVS